MQNKPITHIVRSCDAAGFYRFSRCESLAEAVKKRRELRDIYGHLSAIIITVEPVEIPTSRGPAIGYKPTLDPEFRHLLALKLRRAVR